MSEKDKHYMILLIGGISIATTTTTDLKQNKNRFTQNKLLVSRREDGRGWVRLLKGFKRKKPPFM